MEPVLLVEDHPLVAEATGRLLAGLSSELDVQIAATAAEALERLDGQQWFRVFLDLDVPGSYGLSLFREVQRRRLARICCVVSAFDRREYIREAAACGFQGYIVKSIPVTRFADSVRAVLQGGSSFPQEDTVRRESPTRLTKRQLEILGRVRDGESSKQVARAILLSEGTVNNHMTAIMQVLGASTRTEAVVRAIDLGLLRSMDTRPGSLSEL